MEIKTSQNRLMQDYCRPGSLLMGFVLDGIWREEKLETGHDECMVWMLMLAADGDVL
jgi:hypothetical protein